MRTYNMHEAKTHLSKLVDLAVNGEPFVIARSGKPAVKVMALDAPAADVEQRVGFMAGEICTPEDFNRMGANEIENRFAGEK